VGVFVLLDEKESTMELGKELSYQFDALNNIHGKSNDEDRLQELQHSIRQEKAGIVENGAKPASILRGSRNSKPSTTGERTSKKRRVSFAASPEVRISSSVASHSPSRRGPVAGSLDQNDTSAAANDSRPKDGETYTHDDFLNDLSGSREVGRFSYGKALSINKGLQTEFLQTCIDLWYTYVNQTYGADAMKNITNTHRCDLVDHDYATLCFKAFIPPRGHIVPQHICGGSRLCTVFEDASLHNPMFLRTTCTSIVGCFTKGTIHICDEGCSMATSNVVDGICVCPLSGKTFANTVGKFEDTGHQSVKEAEMSSRTLFMEERAAYNQITIRSATDGMEGCDPVVFPRKLAEEVPPNAFIVIETSSNAHYQLYLLREKMTQYFSADRVSRECLKNADAVNSMLGNINQYCNQCVKEKRPIMESTLRQMNMERIKSQSPFPALVMNDGISEEDVRRFITYYAYFAFCVWKHVIENWEDVMKAERQNPTHSVVSDFGENRHQLTLEVAYENAEQRAQFDQGKLQLEPCALAVWRMISMGVYFKRCESLHVILPALNDMARYGCVVRAATIARSILQSYFTDLVSDGSKYIGDILPIPRLSWEDARKINISLDEAACAAYQKNHRYPVDHLSRALVKILAESVHQKP